MFLTFLKLKLSMANHSENTDTQCNLITPFTHCNLQIFLSRANINRAVFYKGSSFSYSYQIIRNKNENAKKYMMVR